jgi:hypothetical protein
MGTVGRRIVLGAALTVAAAGVVIAASAEDDLAVVKRAVSAQAAPAPTPAEEAAAAEPIPRADDEAERRAVSRRRAGVPAADLRWFKVRITEKGAKKARVNVNVPIALVRALGDDFPIDIGRHSGWRGGRSGREIRLGEVLATLEAGQSLVEIEDDDATVRVWVE